jgi:hypothetical protein
LVEERESRDGGNEYVEIEWREQENAEVTEWRGEGGADICGQLADGVGKS